jgi:hypothetical protein
MYRNIDGISFDFDQDGYTYVGNSPSTECVSTDTSIGGRTYYYGSTSGYYWMVDSQKLGINDCNNDDDTRWRNRYTDSDGDGYCPSSGQTCVGNHAGYRDSCTTYTDCCDAEPDAFPGQTTYFDHPRNVACGIPTYDYDCSGANDKQYTLEYGDCEDCYGDCTMIPGSRGWDLVAAPGCGVQGWYITDSGRCIMRTCEPTGCLWEERTQKCR